MTKGYLFRLVSLTSTPRKKFFPVFDDLSSSSAAQIFITVAVVQFYKKFNQRPNTFLSFLLPSLVVGNCCVTSALYEIVFFLLGNTLFEHFYFPVIIN